MIGIRAHVLAGLVLVSAACSLPSNASAQFFGGNPCVPCGQPIATAPVMPVAIAPSYQTASVDCPCMKPVTETVYQDVEQVDYKPVAKTVKVAKVVTVMEDRDVTTYQQVAEARTVNVPSYTTQTYTDYQQVCQNNSYWRTNYQPVCKPSPCQVDQRTGLLGELNRMSLAFRNSFTPNYTASRQFVPNVVATTVPVQRTVQIPTTRQVTYNVMRSVPVTTTQKVAVQKTVWEDQTVTAYEPVVTKKRVAVGTRTRMAYVDPTSGATTSAQAEPTPAATADSNSNGQSTNNKGSVRLQAAPKSQQVPVQNPIFRQQAPAVQPAPQEASPSAPQPAPRAQLKNEGDSPIATSDDAVPTIARVSAWRTSREAKQSPVPGNGPELSVAKK
ncbi:MAG: hypothetical protein KDA80_03930 [Planctomycetaceae bacterium]|nr:hypothetical protein [Planctomycetaceae bacterium]